MTDAHAVLAKALVLRKFTPKFLKSIDNIQLPEHRSSYIFPPHGVPSTNFFTAFSPFTLRTYLRLYSYVHKYIYNIWRFKFIVNFLIHYYSPRTIFLRSSIHFSRYFRCPRHSGCFYFILLWSLIQHQRSQVSEYCHRASSSSTNPMKQFGAAPCDGTLSEYERRS